MQNSTLRTHALLAAACMLLAACGGSPVHSASDYRQATSAGDPDGSLTTIVGPHAKVVGLTSTLRFPEGDFGRIKSGLFYDGPGERSGTCLFQTAYMNRYFVITKEPQVTAPCDGKSWARFRIGGVDVSFVAHLHTVNYKGTPVTLLEISNQNVPDSIRLTY